MAQVSDPWGTLLEIVQDPKKLGLHHIGLVTSDPAAELAWFAATFGGKVDKLKGQIDGIQYGDVWLLGARGEATPSAGHSNASTQLPAWLGAAPSKSSPNSATI